jgi:hypothetical protein
MRLMRAGPPRFRRSGIARPIVNIGDGQEALGYLCGVIVPDMALRIAACER